MGSYQAKHKGETLVYPPVGQLPTQGVEGSQRLGPYWFNPWLLKLTVGTWNVPPLLWESNLHLCWRMRNTGSHQCTTRVLKPNVSRGVALFFAGVVLGERRAGTGLLIATWLCFNYRMQAVCLHAGVYPGSQDGLLPLFLFGEWIAMVTCAYVSSSSSEYPPFLKFGQVLGGTPTVVSTVGIQHT